MPCARRQACHGDPQHRAPCRSCRPELSRVLNCELHDRVPTASTARTRSIWWLAMPRAVLWVRSVALRIPQFAAASAHPSLVDADPAMTVPKVPFDKVSVCGFSKLGDALSFTDKAGISPSLVGLLARSPVARPQQLRVSAANQEFALPRRATPGFLAFAGLRHLSAVARETKNPGTVPAHPSLGRLRA
jgi:hypothetical protein